MNINDPDLSEASNERIDHAVGKHGSIDSTKGKSIPLPARYHGRSREIHPLRGALPRRYPNVRS